MPTFRVTTKKLSTGANGQKEDAASPFKFVLAVLNMLDCNSLYNRFSKVQFVLHCALFFSEL